MKNIWLLVVKTSLPDSCYGPWDLATSYSAYYNFENAKAAMKKALNDYAFSDNEMFDGNGYIIELTNYINEQAQIEREENLEYNEEWLSSEKLSAIHNALNQIFTGNSVDLKLNAGTYVNAFVEAIISEDKIITMGTGEGQYNGYDPIFQTNMINMSEEKDYYIYLDDKLGQYASAELYIELKKIPLS